MLCRKQMGLVALGFAFLHAIYTFVIPIRYSVRHKLISRVVDEVDHNSVHIFYIHFQEQLVNTFFLFFIKLNVLK